MNFSAWLLLGKRTLIQPVCTPASERVGVLASTGRDLRMSFELAQYGTDFSIHLQKSTWNNPDVVRASVLG
jgi:hypothetical protein